ncbi:hypothetical protein [Pontibacter rugosus]
MLFIKGRVKGPEGLAGAPGTHSAVKPGRDNVHTVGFGLVVQPLFLPAVGVEQTRKGNGQQAKEAHQEIDGNGKKHGREKPGKHAGKPQ